ncbi:MAG: restriction endonuclease subunit S [Luteolibacter sp.]
MSRITKTTASKSKKLEVRSEKRNQDESFSLPTSHLPLHPPALVPKLRFPEFRGAKAWASEPMGEVYSFKGNNSLSRDKLNYMVGSVKNIHYGDIHTKFSSHFDITKELVPFINESEEGIVRDDNLCAEGDMVFADASEDMADIGKCIEIVSLNGERVVSGLHTILARRTGDRIALGFGGHLFKSGLVRAQIQKEAQGAKVLGISANRMRNLHLPLPHAKAEQQKIAACLSSVDDLIAAQARRVDALKTHKKGLLQKLFPSGKVSGSEKLEVKSEKGDQASSFSLQNSHFSLRLPRLRFPEFQNAGEWEEEKLDDLLHFQDGFAFKSTDFVKAQEDATQVIRITDINNKNTNEDKVYIPTAFLETTKLAKYNVNDGDLLLSLTGAAGFNFFFWNGGPATINQRTAKVTPKKKSGHALLGLLEPLIHEKINERGEGQNNNLSKEFLSTIILRVPGPAEQQRIATCLSSLDALITAETQKHEVLKTHKKALMQQLFPSPEEQNTL